MKNITLNQEIFAKLILATDIVMVSAEFRGDKYSPAFADIKDIELVIADRGDCLIYGAMLSEVVDEIHDGLVASGEVTEAFTRLNPGATYNQLDKFIQNTKRTARSKGHTLGKIGLDVLNGEFHCFDII